MHRLGLDQLPQLGKDLVVEALDGTVVAREVEVVADDGDVDGVGVVVVEDAGHEAVGKHFFNLVGVRVGGGRHRRRGGGCGRSGWEVHCVFGFRVGWELTVCMQVKQRQRWKEGVE